MKKTLLLLSLITFWASGIQAQTILGLDVSHYQGTIDWTQVKSPGGKTFAWAKATEGTGFTDPNYVTNATTGTAAGVIMGAYHFAHPETNTAAAEAAYFLSVAGPYIGAGYLPPALDLEDPAGGTPLNTYFAGNAAALTTWVQDWMNAVQNATGVKPVLYTDKNESTFLSSSLNSYGLWIADPDGSATAAPTLYLGNWTTWAFKQYSWTATVPGIAGTGAVDLDVFNGTQTQFNTLISGPATVTAAFTANSTNVCAGNSVTFTDHSTSTGTITGHNWTFTGGTPPNSSSANPVVTYNTAGTYSVKEVVTSSTGADSLTKTSYIHVMPTATLPLLETFQSGTFPPTGWTMNFEHPTDSAWALCTANGYNSNKCMYFPGNCGHVHSTAGQKQQIYTPDYSFASTTNAYLKFDVAYEPYNSTYSDTLEIYYSTDCGASWNSIYYKGGMTLCTTGTTIQSTGTDTSGGNGCFIPPTNNTNAWRIDSISLAAVNGQSSVMFSFESRSGWGNIIYIDNINIASPVSCTPPATPVIQASPGTTSCGPIQLTASSSGCTGCTYSWSNAATGSGISASSTGTYSVTATSGCASLPGTISVTINHAPAVSASASSQQACLNQSVTLSATGTATGYQWSGTGLQTTTGSSVNAIVANSGSQIYTVTGTLNGCTATASTSVNFTTTVTPTINITQTTSNPVCAGTPVSFSASSTNGGGSPVYQWTSSGGHTGTGSTFTLSSAVNSETVRCLIISNANCASPDSVYSNTLTVTTQSPQPVAVSISTPDTNVCSGENIAFTSSVTNGGNSPTYNWYVNNVSSGSGNGYTINNIQSGSTVYCVVTSSSGCVTGSPATSTSVNVHIQNSAQASVTITASQNPVCAGTPVTFVATPGNGGNSPVYVWKLNGNSVGTNNPGYTNSSLQNGDVVSCSMTSSSGCVTTPTVSSNNISMQVDPLPTANAGSNFHISTNVSVILGGNPSASGGTSPYTYAWSPSTGLNSSSVANPVDSGITASTLYTLVVTDSKGCSASGTVNVNVITCTLQTPAVQVNFCDMATPYLAGAAYQWLLQGQAINGATTRFYTATQTGYYNVKVTDTVGCVAQSTDTYLAYPACLTTAIDPVTGNPEFDIYPNPASTELMVSFSNPVSGSVQIEVFDICGQMVNSNITDAITGNKYPVNISALAAGSYLLRVTDHENRFAVKRFIKM